MIGLWVWVAVTGWIILLGIWLRWEWKQAGQRLDALIDVANEETTDER